MLLLVYFSFPVEKVLVEKITGKSITHSSVPLPGNSTEHSSEDTGHRNPSWKALKFKAQIYFYCVTSAREHVRLCGRSFGGFECLADCTTIFFFLSL